MDRRWRIVVPLRLHDAKSRLSTRTASVRRDLVLAMALDVIVAARSCPGVEGVVVVTDPGGQAAVAQAALDGVSTVRDPGSGLNPAIEAGAEGASGPVAALLADVPCVTPELLSLALSKCADRPVMMCDCDGVGTTLLAAPHHRELIPRFGERSRAAHRAAGAHEIPDPYPGAFAGLRRDVDSEVDLWDACRLGVGHHTRSVIDRM